MENDLSNIRFLYFAVTLGVLAVAEAYFPRRSRSLPRSIRWFENFTLIASGWLVAKFTIGFLPFVAASWAYENNIGLLNSFSITSLTAIILTYLLLDLTIYLQHIVFHKIPILWRIHRVHHTDLDLDVSSGFRFHPLEILLSLMIKIVAIIVIGANPTGVIAFEIILNMGSLFNHSNLNIRGRFDKVLRAFIVTPDMHRIHHSVERRETDSNYGFTISLWDRIFRTYRDKSLRSQEDIILGIKEYQNHESIKLGMLFKLPFER